VWRVILRTSKAGNSENSTNLHPTSSFACPSPIYFPGTPKNGRYVILKSFISLLTADLSGPSHTRRERVQCQSLVCFYLRPPILPSPRWQNQEHETTNTSTTKWARTDGTAVENRHDAYHIHSFVSSSVTHLDPRIRLPSVYA
jgi:hypothetical protein